MDARRGNGPSEPLAIVGMACQVPGAGDVRSFWQMLLRGESAVGQIPRERWEHGPFFDPEGKRPNTTYTDVMAAVSGIDRFDPLSFGISPRQAEVMDPQHRILLTTTREALEDAGFDQQSFAGRRVGVYVGISTSDFREVVVSAPLRGVQLGAGEFGDSPNLADIDSRALTADVPVVRPFTMPGSLLNMSAAMISRAFNLRGPSMAVDAACASSLVALNNAVLALRSRQCEVAIVAGVHLNLVPDSLVMFSKIGAVSKSGVCAPFDAGADGFVLGEGAGVIVLAREDTLPARGEVHAWLRGVGCNNDGAGAGPMEPQAAGQRAAIEFALADGGLQSGQIDYVEAHGTATPVGDAVEVESLSSCLPHRGDLPRYLGSAKANVGHAMSAAGIIGLIKTALVLRTGVIPPQPNIRERRDGLNLEARGWRIAQSATTLPEMLTRPHVAGVSAFGFGGTNVHVLLEAPGPTTAQNVVTPCDSWVIPIRGDNVRDVEVRCQYLLDDIDATPDLDLGQVARTLSRREDRGVELLIVTGSILELHEHLRAALAVLKAGGEIPVRIGEDVWFRAARPASEVPRVCFLFTGQGAQNVNELASLKNAVPEVNATVERLVTAADSPGLLDVMYPAELTAEAEMELASTDRCQPALLITQLALAEHLAGAGITPDVVLGHSVGEFAAAVAAGVLSDEHAVRFAARRGEAIVEADIPAGGMIACRSEETVLRALVEAVPSVWVANHNAADQTVLAGTTDGLATAGALLTAAEVAHKVLNVSHAFHSPLLEPANQAIVGLVNGLALEDPKTAFISCISASAYSNAEEIRERWREHALASVRFSDALGTLRDTETVFVQIGAGNALLNLVRSAGVPADHLIAVDSAEHTRLLNRLRAQLRSVGVSVDLAGTSDHRGALLTARPVPAKSLWPVKKRATRRSVAAGGQDSSEAKRTPSAPTGKESSLVQDIISLWREQTALLTTVLGGQTVELPPIVQAAPATPAVSAPSAVVNPPRTTVARNNNALKEIARIGSYAAAALTPGQALVGDLGFDSLMLTDLFKTLQKDNPELSLKDFSPKNLTVGHVMALAAGEPAFHTDDEVLDGAAVEKVARERTITDFPEWQALNKRLRDFDSEGTQNPYFTVHQQVVNDTTRVGDRVLINFSSYNYLGLSGDDRVTARAQEALSRYGTSVSASRLLSGEKPVHRELEAAIARLLKVEDAVTLVGGHSTNVTIIGHILGEQDIVLHDALAHDSIMQGCRLSGATRRPFKHNDAAHLDQLLTTVRDRYRRALVVVEGAYSMDGDIANLPAFIEVAKRHDALLMVDEAHSIGVLGAGGGGIGEHFDVDRAQVDIWMGTLSKSLSSCGGYLGGSRALIEYLRYSLPGFIYSCGLPPASAGASLASIEILQAEPERVATLHANADYMRAAFVAAGLSFGDSSGTPIIPFVVGDSRRSLLLAAQLREAGINVDPILYPAVPNDQTRLRFFVTASHSFEQIDLTVKILAGLVQPAAQHLNGA
ncbi:type I polyketide synthase [Mycobacteroides abscessus]|uniref:type I polyketide synthase n=2 Tax=Mycobacteroides abscessus TaxID=36809 RepID=UPI0002E38AB4|nr:type I polyketide synthase [Mycobacteroides abscessus]SHP38660.1 polyketide synthase family protein [Mycobacteroides abscessus subsp. abscessus]SII14435.1 polyketide synthase family protein [Mycobacteroides abscessus subsp. abscessus]SLD20699.1 polyketide synthase family protein [Mycobacteroides abscessus subsp. abscessus]